MGITFAYIRIPSTPILAYLRTSLKTSLRKPSNLKAIQKMTSLKGGVRFKYEKFADINAQKKNISQRFTH